MRLRPNEAKNEMMEPKLAKVMVRSGTLQHTANQMGEPNSLVTIKEYDDGCIEAWKSGYRHALIDNGIKPGDVEFFEGKRCEPSAI